jgi:hypothetical protein
MADPASLTADELDSRVQRLVISLGERLTDRDRDLVGVALRRARERDDVVEALVDRGLEVDRLLARNEGLEAVFEAALAHRQAAGEQRAGATGALAPAGGADAGARGAGGRRGRAGAEAAAGRDPRRREGEGRAGGGATVRVKDGA